MTAPAPLPPPELTAAGLSHAGQKRAENEDAFGVFTDERFFVVADGVGGHNAGEVASRLTVESLARFFRGYHADPLQKWPHPVDRSLSLGANLLRVGLQVANTEVRAAAAADRSRLRMASTVVALAVGDQQVAVAHLGDARAYRLRGDSLERLTRDHSLVEEMLASQPHMKPEEVASFAHRNVITRSVGSKAEAEPDVKVEPLARGDVFLLCTDGLCGVIGDHVLAEILRRVPVPADACQALVDTANAAGGPDNITAVVVRVGT